MCMGIGLVKKATGIEGTGATLRKPQQSEPKHLQTKSICYTIVNNVPRVLLPHSEAEKKELEYFNFAILLSSSSFFFFITHNSRTIGYI